MARTHEQITAHMLGQQLFQIAGLQAQCDKQIEDITRLTRENEKLKAENAALKPAQPAEPAATTVTDAVNGSGAHKAERSDRRRGQVVQ